MGLGIAVDKLRNTARTSGLLWTASLMLDRVGIPALGWWKSTPITRERLTEQVRDILRLWGMPQEHALITTEHILYADLHGIDSHGCAMLVDYHRSLLGGKLNMTPVVQIVRESPTTALIDGGGGLGHVPADMAMKLAIAKCRENGVATVVVRNSGHFGAAGTYSSMATREGLIGIASTSAKSISVVPTFGVEAKLGTNPISLAAPSKRNKPFLLDMATSSAPLGKIMTHWRKGKSIPIGWAIDPYGEAVTSPRLAYQHKRLLPLGSNHDLGSHRGYGLATMVEILCGVLSGSQPKPMVGHFFMAIDPQQFREEGEFENDLDTLMDDLRVTKPINRNQPVLVAGDPEYAAFEQRSCDGIPLSRSVVEDIRSICRQSNVPFILNASAK